MRRIQALSFWKYQRKATSVWLRECMEWHNQSSSLALSKFYYMLFSCGRANQQALSAKFGNFSCVAIATANKPYGFMPTSNYLDRCWLYYNISPRIWEKKVHRIFQSIAGINSVMRAIMQLIFQFNCCAGVYSIIFYWHVSGQKFKLRSFNTKKRNISLH